MRLRNFAEASDALRSYIPNKRFEDNYRLDRMRSLLAALGDPQETFATVHIAGTSGKTSTAYLVRALLEAAGQKTGLTVSPHVDSVTERIQLSGHPISEDAFVDHLERLLTRVESTGLSPTYFEVLVALAYLVFHTEDVDYAVVETGLGGLLDGTNTIARRDKVCVITDIGLDHTEVLGETVEEIAGQKAGIIQPGNAVVLQGQDPAVERVVAEAARARGAQLTVVRDVPGGPLAASSDLALFQRRNLRVAEVTYRLVAARDGLPPLSALDLPGLADCLPPARMEIREVQGREIVIDGAHNPQKLRALRGALQERGYGRVAVLANVVGAPSQKVDDCLRELLPIASLLVVPDFAVVQDVDRRSVPAAEMVARARRLGFENVQAAADPRAGLAAVLSGHEKSVLVTGSLYLAAQVRVLLAPAQTDR